MTLSLRRLPIAWVGFDRRLRFMREQLVGARSGAIFA